MEMKQQSQGQYRIVNIRESLEDSTANTLKIHDEYSMILRRNVIC